MAKKAKTEPKNEVAQTIDRSNGIWHHPGPSEGVPKRVAVLCLGASVTEWITLCLSKGVQPGQFGSNEYFDEVWTLNRGIRTFPHDLAFIMDDMRMEDIRDPNYGALMRTHSKPIITCTKYPDYPKAIPYPLMDVLRHVGRPNYYLHNSVPLVLAYASMIGVPEVVLFGADYTHMQSVAHEDDRANAEYWVGWCRAKGMRVGVPTNSTLLNAHRGLHLYGYLQIPEDAYREMRGW